MHLLYRLIPALLISQFASSRTFAAGVEHTLRHHLERSGEPTEFSEPGPFSPDVFLVDDLGIDEQAFVDLQDDDDPDRTNFFEPGPFSPGISVLQQDVDDSDSDPRRTASKSDETYFVEPGPFSPGIYVSVLQDVTDLDHDPDPGAPKLDSEETYIDVFELGPFSPGVSVLQEYLSKLEPEPEREACRRAQTPTTTTIR